MIELGSYYNLQGSRALCWAMPWGRAQNAAGASCSMLNAQWQDDLL